MVSATTLAFSDPELKDERVTTIKYENAKKRKILLYYAPVNVDGVVTRKILELLRKGKQKLMIAYNSVSYCFDIATYLHKHAGIDKGDIKILCSNRSKEKVGEYFSELDSTELPGRINFVTSAYFTGYDLTERYHLISVSSARSSIHTLSDKRLKQIAGRCRHKEGLLSESIMYNTVPQNSVKDSATIADIINAANSEIEALKCIEKHYNGHPVLKATTDAIRELVTDNTRTNTFQFVRIWNKIPKISYLNIDSYIESIRVRNELYLTENALPSTLRNEGHKITKYTIDPIDIGEKNKIDKISFGEEITRVVNDLKALPKVVTPKQLLTTKEFTYSTLQKYIIKWMYELYRYIDRDHLLDLIEKAGQTRDKRRIQNLLYGAYFLSLPPESFYKRLVNFHIPERESFSKEELLEKWNEIYTEFNLHKKLTSGTIAVQTTKIHFKTTKRRSDGIKHFIVKDNPYELRLLKHRPNKKQKQKEDLLHLLS